MRALQVTDHSVTCFRSCLTSEGSFRSDCRLRAILSAVLGNCCFLLNTSLKEKLRNSNDNKMMTISRILRNIFWFFSEQIYKKLKFKTIRGIFFRKYPQNTTSPLQVPVLAILRVMQDKVLKLAQNTCFRF